MAWGLLLADVYFNLPTHKHALKGNGVTLPPLSAWVLDNAFWAVPAVGLVTVLLACQIRQRTLRWAVPAVVGILCFVALFAIRLQGYFMVRPVGLE
jgi:hypothetical protein